jgi:predicted lipoprotein with Yx(FWY)xxD motif
VQIGSVNGKNVLVNGDGRTLYAYSKDKTLGAGTCDASCASTWPPVPGPAVAGAGVNAKFLGEHKRSDGSEQVTYYGDPLYYFSGDTTSGEAKGAGLGGVWFLETAAGKWTT